MLVLVGLPFDAFALMLWLVGAFAALASSMSLVRIALARRRESEQVRAPRPSRAIRPAATLAIFVVAAVVTTLVTERHRAEADALGRALAQEALATCERDGRCPATPEGWDPDGCRAVGFMRVCYRRGEDDRSCVVTVRHRTDDLLVVIGGPDGLTEEHRCC